jgi:hypothetical protein
MNADAPLHTETNETVRFNGIELHPSHRVFEYLLRGTYACCEIQVSLSTSGHVDVAQLHEGTEWNVVHGVVCVVHGVVCVADIGVQLALMSIPCRCVGGRSPQVSQDQLDPDVRVLVHGGTFKGPFLLGAENHPQHLPLDACRRGIEVQ